MSDGGGRRRAAVWSSPVRYVECDAQGVVFNGHYLTWADESATALMGALGTPYAGILARGLDTSVVASELAWSSPALWGDVVEVDASVVRLGRTSFAFRFAIRVGERSCCVVTTTYVLVDADRRPVPLPDDLRAAWS